MIEFSNNAIGLLIYSVICGVSFILFGYDKFAAIKRRRRISERTLLLLSLAGGWPAALLAQQLFRHKTQKKAFLMWFYAAIIGNLVALLGIFIHFH